LTKVDRETSFLALSAMAAEGEVMLIGIIATKSTRKLSQDSASARRRQIEAAAACASFH